MSPTAPVSQTERISAIDSLRGFALLGILLMNIVAMGLYDYAYDNPTVTGGASGSDLWVWIVMHVIAEGKMRCLFSLVFGASVVLLLDRLEGRTDAADIYYRRTFWLLAFGTAHAYLLWLGEILYPYALCGLLLYPFRNARPRRLIAIGVILLVVNAGFYIRHGFQQRDRIAKGQAALAAVRQGKKLTEDQEGEKSSYEKLLKRIHPDAAQLKKINDEWRGTPWQVIKARAAIVYDGHAIPYYQWYQLDIWSMMFIGMALMRLRVLAGEQSLRYYGVCMAIGYSIGIPLNSFTAWVIVKHWFDPPVQTWASSVYDLGRLSVALGHLGLVFVLCKTGHLKWLTRSLAAIGQTALSNYLFQSVVTAFLFTGYGFSLFGRLQRHELYYVVAAIWAVQLIVSPIWVRHFRFGPMEWCWRSLTYWKRQPMRLRVQREIVSAAAS